MAEQSRSLNLSLTRKGEPIPYQPGDILLEKYRIEALIGQGAFGDVYCVMHLKLNVLRALKILRRDAPGIGSTEFTDSLARFQLEAQLGAKLNSPSVQPNLLQIHDFHQEKDLLALEMEYAPGGSLSERLGKAKSQEKAIPIDESLQIALDVSSGLAVLHARDIVHRDIKPGNILFDGKGRAKLADLGLAQIPGGLSLRSQLSNPLLHPGTPGYMSPEQELSGSYLTPASDIYALGATLFEILTGRVYHSQRPGTLASKLRSEIPIWLDDLLAQMLAKSTEERPWDGDEAGELLRQAYSKLTSGPFWMPTIHPEYLYSEELDTQKQQTEEESYADAFQGLMPEVRSPDDAEFSKELILDLGEGVTMEFVRVPAGEFWMGSDKSIDKQAQDNETPRHKVYLDEYLMGKTPVTNRQYQVFAQKTKHRAPSHWKNGKIPVGLENHPVVHVSWEDAAAFCKWASQAVGQSVRLPSEAEWEKAARWKWQGEALLYPWGNQPPTAILRNFNNIGILNIFNGAGKTTPVGKYSPKGDSPYGCVDMAGNVWEWCADWYADDYYKNTPAKNPPGSASEKYRVLRGGAWSDGGIVLRSAYRSGYDPANSYNNNLGFRCARSH